MLRALVHALQPLLGRTHHASALVQHGVLARTLAHVSMGNLRPAPGATKRRKRVGRGRGLGGRQCGRGNSGQKSRSGAGIPRGFEGGQVPLHKRVPMKGRAEGSDCSQVYTRVGLGRLQWLVDTQRLRADRPIDTLALHRAGLRDVVRSGHVPGGFLVTAAGAHLLRSRLHVQAAAFEPDAIARIEGLGGTAVAVFHGLASLRALLKLSRLPEDAMRAALQSLPRHGAPAQPSQLARYASYAQRGYLHADVQRRLLAEDPSFAQRYALPAPQTHARYEPPRLASIVPDLRAEGLLSA